MGKHIMSLTPDLANNTLVYECVECDKMELIYLDDHPRRIIHDGEDVPHEYPTFVSSGTEWINNAGKRVIKLEG